MEVLNTSSAPDMNTTQRSGIMQRWFVIQHELMPELRSKVGALTPKLEQVIHTLEWVRIEEFVSSTWGGCGRPEHDRGMLANAFVAKAVLGLDTVPRFLNHISALAKEITNGCSSTATIRNTERTRGSGWAKKARNRRGFGISRLAASSFPSTLPSLGEGVVG